MNDKVHRQSKFMPFKDGSVLETRSSQLDIKTTFTYPQRWSLNIYSDVQKPCAFFLKKKKKKKKRSRKKIEKKSARILPVTVFCCTPQGCLQAIAHYNSGIYSKKFKIIVEFECHLSVICDIHLGK